MHVARYPVVLMTSHGNEQVAVEAMKAGAVDYVVKSAATLADMPNIVERALRQWQHIVARQQAEERFAKAFYASPAPMGITRLADARLLAVNEAFLRATGYTQEEVVGHTILELHWWVCPEDRQRFFEEFHVHRCVRNFPVQRRNKSGEIREILLSAEHIDFDGAPCLLTSTFDITERQHMEKALHQAERLASLGTLAAGLAHELNQPLTAIRVTVDSVLYGLQRGWSVSEERLADSLRLISEQCQRTAAILEDIRLFARDHTGHQQSSSSLHAGIEWVLRLLGTQLTIHDITLHQHIPPALPCLAIP